ncbi:hypothetical protein [Priestia endophytica]|uniref:hypothetical protein n=1 Tax=Priestia endophytica TaxID=135735 RepID=UPI000DCA717E|nr:hypothetical protein [Priestia endophytica]RAS72767.1 hypothetical protein A4R27_25685 [Priestia endophytica]
MKDNMLEFFPFSYFQINTRGSILVSSKRAQSLFNIPLDLLNIVHIDDQLKALELITSFIHTEPLTINLRLQMLNGSFTTFTCTINWERSIGHLVCIEKKPLISSFIEVKNRTRL